MAVTNEPGVLRIELVIASSVHGLDRSDDGAWDIWGGIADNLGDDWWDGSNGEEFIREIRSIKWVT